MNIADLFTGDSSRFDHLSRRLGPLLFDFSKQRVSVATLELLYKLANSRDLARGINELFSGSAINNSEQRPAMHWLLRSPASEPFPGREQVAIEMEKMAQLVERLQQGEWRGFSDEPITDVVNIGVGGSDTGPQLAATALEEFTVAEAVNLRIHFVSMMDGTQLARLLAKLNPATTLFVIASKSFTTADTVANAETARSWLGSVCGNPRLMSRHWIGISANPAKMTEWGISTTQQLMLWDWVGGRYSLWSAIGFTVALSIGMQGFCQLLAGAHMADEHFKSASWDENIPVLMALLGIWNRNFLDLHNHVIAPYDGRMELLPRYLAQLEMESNGKSVTSQGDPVAHATAPILSGQMGTDAQHSFYQLLHQGTVDVSMDFIAVACRRHHRHCSQELSAQHQATLANCLAQSRLLAFGDQVDAGAASRPSHRRYRGNQPVSTLLLEELSPFSLGLLLALYEHKVFTQAMIWQINPFDQWGVEMGKSIATDILKELCQGSVPDSVDDSTAGLLRAICRGRTATHRDTAA